MVLAIAPPHVAIVNYCALTYHVFYHNGTFLELLKKACSKLSFFVEDKQSRSSPYKILTKFLRV